MRVDRPHVETLFKATSIQGLVQPYLRAGLQETLERTLLIAYQASLLQHEGDNLRFALLFSLEAHRASRVQRFRHPIELTPKQLKSMASAFDPRSHGLVVAPMAMDRHSPTIIGTTARPRSPLPPPQLHQPPLLIDVEAPGVVSLAIGEARVLFRRDEVHEVTRGMPDLSAIVDTQALVRQACTLRRSGERVSVRAGQIQIPVDENRWLRHRSEYRMIVARSAVRIVEQTLTSLARKMVGSRRGGAILLLPPTSERQGLFHGGRWYQQPDPQISREITGVLTLEALDRLARIDKSMSTEAGSGPSQQLVSWAHDRLRPALRSTLASLESACQHCADLTRADGATVLTTEFGIEGFSVKLTTSGQRLPSAMVRFLETRGNRHRSMAGTVARQAGSVGLVVSQDGEITLMVHPPSGGPRHLEIVL